MGGQRAVVRIRDLDVWEDGAVAGEANLRAGAGRRLERRAMQPAIGGNASVGGTGRCELVWGEPRGSRGQDTIAVEPSACFGKKPLADPNEFLISLGEELWDNGRACGSVYDVTCIFESGNQCVAQEGGSLTARARVVDYCKDCRGDVAMLLSLQAFASIANIDAVSKVWASFAKICRHCCFSVAGDRSLPQIRKGTKISDPVACFQVVLLLCSSCDAPVL
ncbi:hypothetical protein KSP40_PGU007148 [Platanthera guangdongensis]|uniref:Expansin-like EG45 domain-containing protein n=1 Tax=Platanthera guangdongensis TaxID=2320717 RepID=A0ABR2LVY8_9ASPA